MRQAMRTDGDLHLQARCTIVAQHFADPADGLAVEVRLLEDLGHHDLAGCGRADVFTGNEHILVDALVVRHHHRDAGILDVASDHLQVGPREDLHHGTFGPAPSIDAGLPCQHAVTVQDTPHLARAEEEVITARVGHEEAEDIRVSDHPTGREFEALDGRIAAAAVAQQLAVALHGAQPAPERLHLCVIIRRDAHCSRDTREVERSIGRVEQREDGLA